MDLSDPTRAITATLDGAVLAVLATAGKPLSVGQVAQQATRGSEIGVRRSLARLVEQGIAGTTLMGRNYVYQLNRDHVAATIADGLAALRSTLWSRLREELGGWRPRPMYAWVFGSAARGDGDELSDIDLLLVHPPFPSESKPGRVSQSLRAQIADALGESAVSGSELDVRRRWETQIDRLRQLVLSWTGNPLQVIDLSLREWRNPAEQHRSLLAEVDRDGIELLKARAFSTVPAGRD